VDRKSTGLKTLPLPFYTRNKVKPQTKAKRVQVSSQAFLRLIIPSERAAFENALNRSGIKGLMRIVPLAGVLNDVFLASSGRSKCVVKRFTEWNELKWLALNIIAIGSTRFTISGKARMKNEYSINRYLAKRGIKVPKIRYVSAKDRILLEEYVPGVPLSKFMAGVSERNRLTSAEREFAEILGETFARIHRAGVAVGDSRPDNFIRNGNYLYSVDLEQAGKGGDYAWDIAELLFYSGHYSRLPVLSGGLRDVVEAFVRGYRRTGDPAILKRAGSAKYMKMFSFWTAAPIILKISKLLKNCLQ